MNPDMETVVRTVIAGSPLGKLLGLEVELVEPDQVRLRLPYRCDVTTLGDLVHGGAISALVDTAATAAAWTRADLGRNSRGTTVTLTINFLNGARGRDVVATAKVLQRGRSLLVCDVEAHDTEGLAVARALVTYKLDHRDPAATT